MSEPKTVSLNVIIQSMSEKNQDSNFPVPLYFVKTVPPQGSLTELAY